MLVRFSVGFIAISSGRLTNFSTSSALLPGHCVIMVMLVFVTSGNASMVVCLKLRYPARIRINVPKKMKYLFLSANTMMFFIILFIYGQISLVTNFLNFRR